MSGEVNRFWTLFGLILKVFWPILPSRHDIWLRFLCMAAGGNASGVFQFRRSGVPHPAPGRAVCAPAVRGFTCDNPLLCKIRGFGLQGGSEPLSFFSDAKKQGPGGFLAQSAKTDAAGPQKCGRRLPALFHITGFSLQTRLPSCSNRILFAAAGAARFGS